MATPAPGTIPALPPYQPGALALTGQEIFELASSPTATSAISAWIYIGDLVGKAPSVMTSATPVANDIIAFYQKSSGLPKSCPVGNLSQPAGNLPVAGNTGQLLAKNSLTNYDAAWFNITTFVTAGTSIFLTGSTTIAVGVATGGIGSTQIGTNAVQNFNLRQGAGLSIIGVTGSVTANEADIAGTAAQVLRVNDGGTGLAFGAVNLASAAAVTGILQSVNVTAINLAASGAGGVQGVLPGANYSAVNLAASGVGGVQGVLGVTHGGTNTSTLTAFGVPYGNGTSTVGITAAGTTGWPLVGNGTAVAPAFAVLGVPGGGLGTAVLTAHAVLVGAGTSIVHLVSATAAGNLLIDQGVAADPVFTPASGDWTISGNGTATIGANKVTYAKMQQGTGLSFIGVAGTANANLAAITGTASTVPFINAGGTTLGFGSVSQLVDTVNTTQGSILYRSNTSWVALGGGTNGQVLQTQGTSANPQWVGGMVLLNTLSPAGVASTNDTSSLTTTYRNYMIVFENIVPATNTVGFAMQIATTGSAWQASSYVSLAAPLVNGVQVSETNTATILLSGIRATTSVQNTTTNGLFGFIYINNPGSTAFRKTITGSVSYLATNAGNTASIANAPVSAYWDGASNAWTGINFAFTAGNIATGTIKIYGIF